MAASIWEGQSPCHAQVTSEKNAWQDDWQPLQSTSAETSAQRLGIQNPGYTVTQPCWHVAIRASMPLGHFAAVQQLAAGLQPHSMMCFMNKRSPMHAACTNWQKPGQMCVKTPSARRPGKTKAGAHTPSPHAGLDCTTATVIGRADQPERKQRRFAQDCSARQQWRKKSPAT